MKNDNRALSFEEMAGSLKALGLFVMQLNTGRYCNQMCTHCHVGASPERKKEIMTRETMDCTMAVLKGGGFESVELTGGAPELHPLFGTFLDKLSSLGIQVIVRTNLTALLEPEAKGLAFLMKERGVHLVASLPCYNVGNVREQRGEGVFEKSILALKMLNSIGYGIENSLPLILVYNPLGPALPGKQKDLEDNYRKELGKRYGISFTRLIALANMPAGRFHQKLLEQNKENEYLDLLKKNFNREVLTKLMCRRNISVDWDGIVYDCDFNLALRLPVQETSSHISSFNRESFKYRTIMTKEHCFGCTAGSGSSCSGALEVE